MKKEKSKKKQKSDPINSKKNVEVEVEPKEWNLGTMMLRFWVDPSLLGWDDDLEDWAEIDNSA